MNPSAQLFSGTSVTLAPVALRDVVALAITLMGGWRDAEINYRGLFAMWAKQLAIPVYVQLAMDNYPWHRRFWVHTFDSCVAVDRKMGDALCETAR